jgi:hypothetical protein
MEAKINAQSTKHSIYIFLFLSSVSVLTKSDYTPEVNNVKEAVVLYMHVLNQVTIMPLTADLHYRSHEQLMQ